MIYCVKTMRESSDDFTTEQMSEFYVYVYKTIFYIFAAVTAIFENKTQKGWVLYETDLRNYPL